MAQDWKDRVIADARGTQTGAIVKAAFQRNTGDVQEFGEHAIVTSDGFVMCDFTDGNGYHWCAFVGAYEDLKRNVGRLAAYSKLDGFQVVALVKAVEAWCGKSPKPIEDSLRRTSGAWARQ